MRTRPAPVTLLGLLASLLSLGTAHAQLLLGVSRGAGAAPSFSITYQTSYDSGGISTSTPSSTALSIGAADSHRVVVAAVVASAATSVSLTDLKCGSTSMTPVVTDSGTRVLDIYELLVTSGTTCTLNATYSGTLTRFSADVWTVLNASGDAHDNRSGANPTTSGSSTLNIASLTIGTSGGAIAAYRSAATGAVTWSQDAGSAGSKSSEHSNGASLLQSAFTNAAPGASPIQYTVSQTSTFMRGAAVSYKP